MSEDLPLVSVVIVAHNNRNDLEACLTSLKTQTYSELELIVVDSGSTDGSADFACAHFPEVNVIDAGGNVGYGAANNIGATLAVGELLAFLNPDAEAAPDCVGSLVKTIITAPGDVGFVTPKILLRSETDRINTCGNDVHFTAVPACRGWYQDADWQVVTEEVNSFSGAAFLVRKSVFEELGGFDDDFFMYVEDNDLSWRARLAGYRCLCEPNAIVYHDYIPRFGANKFYYLERNRYRMLLKNLRWRTLLLMLPALVLTEVVTWGFALLQGFDHFSAKIRAYLWFARYYAIVLRDRRVIQKSRKMPDAAIIRDASSGLAYGLAQEGSAAKIGGLLFDPIFKAMHSFYRLIITW